MRFVAIAGVHGNGVYGEGNSQFIEILPPRLVGTNKTYRIQVALDGKHFLDDPVVTLKVNNEAIQGESGFVQCGKNDLKDVVVKHIDHNTGAEISSRDVYQGYSVSMVQAYPIQPKEIPGYRLVKEPVIDWENTWVDDGKTYVYEYERTEEVPDTGHPENPGTGGGSSASAVPEVSHSDTQAAKTGDELPVIPYAVSSGLTLAAILLLRKRK